MIKIAIELPEFEKELSIAMTLKKDGEVIYTSSSSPDVKAEITSPAWKQDAEEEKEKTSKKKTTKKSSGGNMMDISL